MPLDQSTRKKAQKRSGVVLASELGDHPRRQADRLGLVHLHHGAFVAATQPQRAAVLLASVRETAGDRDVVVMDEGALWLHGGSAPPPHLVLGVPLGSEFAVRPPLRFRRVAASVLDGRRTLRGCQVVSLEIAVIQVCARWPEDKARALIEDLVRRRQTTLFRLRSRCRRGLKGSARVRKLCDELAGGSMDADVRRLKAALEARGVTDLECEVRFSSGSGCSAYADLFHRATNTAYEVDGYLSHSERARFRADRRRDRWMRADHGVVTLRIDVMEIREDLEALADELVPHLLGPLSRQSA